MSADDYSIVYRNHRVLFEVRALFTNPNHRFEDLEALTRANPGTSPLDFIDPANVDPFDKLQCFGRRETRWLESTRGIFEVSAHVPMEHTAQSLIDAIARALEPHGWGVVGSELGAIQAEELSFVNQRRDAIARKTGKPLW